MHPSVTWVCQFLHCLFMNGLSYSVLNTARSVISNLNLEATLNSAVKPVGQHPLVCRYLKGVFNKNGPVPRYNTIWPVEKVPDYLKLLWPLEKITLKDLTLKLVMLIALTTGQRCQTLTLLDMSEGSMQQDHNCYSFTLTDHVQKDRPGNVFGTLRLFKYLVPELCVYV